MAMSERSFTGRNPTFFGEIPSCGKATIVKANPGYLVIAVPVHFDPGKMPTLELSSTK
jgi:hypothetical protein